MSEEYTYDDLKKDTGNERSVYSFKARLGRSGWHYDEHRKHGSRLEEKVRDRHHSAAEEFRKKLTESRRSSKYDSSLSGRQKFVTRESKSYTYNPALSFRHTIVYPENFDSVPPRASNHASGITKYTFDVSIGDKSKLKTALNMVPMQTIAPIALKLAKAAAASSKH
jgi:hypothetical protein